MRSGSKLQLMLAAATASLTLAAPAHAQFSGSAVKQPDAAPIVIGGPTAPTVAPTAGGPPVHVPATGELSIGAPLFSSPDAMKDVAAKITGIVTDDLTLIGAFDFTPANRFASTPLDLNVKPVFTDWAPVAAALVVGSVQPTASGGLNVSYRLYDTVNGTQILGRQYSMPSTEQWRRVAHKVAGDIYEKLADVPPAFDSRITYVSQPASATASQTKLGIVDQDGANSETIATGVSSLQSPRWAPDGQTLVYTADAPVPGKTGSSQLTTILYDLATGRREPLVAGAQPNADARFSADGRSLVYSQGAGKASDIYLMPLGTRKATKIVGDAGADTQPALSPDGVHIAFVSDREGAAQIFLTRVDGQDETCPNGSKAKACRITSGAAASGPVFSPKGDVVAFAKSGAGINLVDLKTGAERTIGQTAAGDASPSFAPNGALVAFARETKGGQKSTIYMVSLDGTRLGRLQTPAEAFQPDWGPLLK